jgi:PBP1b-binding outer membrane lipoprotein LpoB
MEKNIKLILMLIASVLLISGCGDKDPRDAKKKQKLMNDAKNVHQQSFKRMKEQRLRTAVRMLVVNVGNIQNGGGYQMWTATKMADKLISLSQTASQAPTGGTKANAQSISYTKNKVSQPWQIVLIPNDRKKQIIIMGYGGELKKPLVQTQVPVSTY